MCLNIFRKKKENCSQGNKERLQTLRCFAVSCVTSRPAREKKRDKRREKEKERGEERREHEGQELFMRVFCFIQKILRANFVILLTPTKET